jgi:peptidoglycan endopeptidase LytF
MQKSYFLILFAFIYNLSASKAAINIDSIGVENHNGKKIIIHKIVAKDTYYSLGRRYNVSPKTIMTYNDNKYLQLNVIIKVPTELPFVTSPSGSIGTSSKTSPGATTTAGAITSNGATTEEGVIIDHIVKQKENLNMLAEKYGTTVNQIKDLNKLRSINLRIGQVLKISAKKGLDEVPGLSTAPVVAETVVTVAKPASTPILTPSRTTVPTQTSVPAPKAVSSAPVTGGTDLNKEELVVHTVASNETIYSIATSYHMTMDQVKAKNNMTGNSLHVGQKLLIKGQYPVKVPFGTSVPTSENDTSVIKNPSLRLPPSRYGLNQVDEKGTAVWITDQDLDATKMLVLHRTAPIGTVMKITNPMSNRSTFAKVVGKFTENESTKDVIIVLTKAVADALGALDKRFFCNLTYSGQVENEQ